MQSVTYYGEKNPRTRKQILEALIEAVVGEYVGELENTLQDTPEDYQIYKDAEKELNDKEGLKETIYKEAMECKRLNFGFMQSISTDDYLKFEGKENIMKIIEEKINEW